MSERDDILRDVKELESSFGIELYSYPRYGIVGDGLGLISIVVFLMGGLAGGVLGAASSDLWKALKALIIRLLKKYINKAEKELGDSVLPLVLYVFSEGNTTVYFFETLRAQENSFRSSVMLSEKDISDGLVGLPIGAIDVIRRFLQQPEASEVFIEWDTEKNLLKINYDRDEGFPKEFVKRSCIKTFKVVNNTDAFFGKKRTNKAKS